MSAPSTAEDGSSSTIRDQVQNDKTIDITEDAATEPTAYFGNQRNLNDEEKSIGNEESDPTHLTPSNIRQNTNMTGLSRYDTANDEVSIVESSINLSRKASRNTTGYDKLIREASNLSTSLPPMGNGRPYPKHLGSRDPYVVQFDGADDETHPFNWPLRTKILYTAVAGFSAFCIAVGSAMFSASAPSLMENYHIGWPVAALTTSLYVFGFAAGPVIYGPLSELFGRKIVLIPSTLGFTLFAFAVATAKDIQTIMICRFFGGFIGAAPLVVAPAAMADMFDNRSRGTAITLFAMVLFGGPMIGPVMGAFIAKSYLGWRWTSYIIGIIGAASFISSCFLLEETHHPIILKKRAEELRRRTGNWAIYAPHEEINLSIKEIVEKNITRPMIMLFQEPILFLISLYNSFIYGMLYLFLTAIPLIFTTKYEWIPGVSELPYISMLIGTAIGGVILILFEIRYNKKTVENGGKIVPEERLPPMIIGGFVFVIGMFWVGWTGNYKTNYWAPVIGVSFIGAGLMLIFLPCFNYIIDCYLLYAASALAANTFMRSAMASAFPLFSRQMFVNLGIQWASTLLGCLGAIMIPVPFLFYIYGKRVRQKSKFAFDLS
ncbi:uncharacterized protein KGF55_004378 [Candida pseudojiufengensis]|uniref:uncharacterized protein n=1 Tax=Candida pseudojiufengensis TaxID=497109 RepID=UPI0022248904|nr:uncharacterized protein KGF55_004378 [Candida pseudojiufengensis]KAI5960808.1 hypothetical protein KGF55_004378 [Candida pseudojiufengensis]